MIRKRLAAQSEETAERLARAEAASEEISQQTDRVDDQVGFFQRLRAGWEEVHKKNNLAGLFADEWGKTK